MLVLLSFLHWTARPSTKGPPPTIREIVACETAKDRAISACASPLASRWIASCRWCGVRAAGRPNLTPRAFARALPSPVRARISERSNLLKDEEICAEPPNRKASHRAISLERAKNPNERLSMNVPKRKNENFCSTEVIYVSNPQCEPSL